MIQFYRIKIEKKSKCILNHKNLMNLLKIKLFWACRTCKSFPGIFGENNKLVKRFISTVESFNNKF